MTHTVTTLDDKYRVDRIAGGYLVWHVAGPQAWNAGEQHAAQVRGGIWTITEEPFSVEPSIRCSCGWHVTITDGHVVTHADSQGG